MEVAERISSFRETRVPAANSVCAARTTSGDRACLREEDAKDSEARTGISPSKGKGDRMTKTISAKAIHDKRMAKNPEYRAAYDALDEEFTLIGSMLRARARARLTQTEVAVRVGTTESAVSRLESGGGKPSTRALERYAETLGHRLRITLEPASR
jgi:DNA-binding XRE family transcriptional regulator